MAGNLAMGGLWGHMSAVGGGGRTWYCSWGLMSEVGCCGFFVKLGGDDQSALKLVASGGGDANCTGSPHDAAASAEGLLLVGDSRVRVRLASGLTG